MTDPDLGPRSVGRPAAAPGPGAPQPERVEIDGLLRAVARGDDASFARLYDLLSPRVFGLARRVLRDPAQAEEMAQEVLVEVWRSASRFDPERGSGLSWVLTIAHRRTVDRVRSEQASTVRMQKVAAASAQVPYDEVADQVGSRLERQQVRRCLDGLTELQREAITMAYYGGHTYREVSSLLDVALPTVKTRMRDGLIRLRDCLSVEADPMTSPDIHALGGAYALDAVDDLERAAFDRHLAECEMCAVEVDEYRETAGRLAEGSWSVPPPRMREQVLARAAATPQLPPLGHRRGGTPPVTRWRRLAVAASAVAVLGVGTAATTYAVQDQRLGAEQVAAAGAAQRADSIQAVLAAPDAALHAGALTGGGRVTVVTSDTQNAGVVVLADAPPPGPDRAYQLWVLDDVTPISVGLLPAGQAQATTLIAGVRGRAAFAVSLEPAGGSPAPTTTPLVGISLV